MENKLPPHSIEAEEAVLGSILIDADCYDRVISIISPADFSRETNKWIFEAMGNIAPAIDQITVCHELDRLSQLQQIGGPSHISNLIANTPTSIHAAYYARLIADCAYKRRMIVVAGNIASLAYNGADNPEDLSANAIQLISNLDPPGKHSLITPKEHATEIASLIGDRIEGEYGNINYGYIDLDRMLGGMYPGDLIILGARPSVGKSQLLLEVAHNVAYSNNPVLFSAIEMSLKQVSERELSMGTGLTIQQIRRGEFNPDAEKVAMSIVGQLSDVPLYFICGKCSLANIKQRATILKQTTGLKLIIVDYLQLLRDRNDKSMGRDLRERIGYVSGELKNIAIELEVTILVASQFSRDVEYRADHRPRLSDLRESGDLEQDADVVMLLHRAELYDDTAEKGTLDIGIAKVRQGGQTGIIKLAWDDKFHRYKDYSKER